MQDLSLRDDSLALPDVVARHLRVSDVETVEVSLWVTVLVSLALDVYTTSLGLSAGLTEGNPLMRWAIGGFGFEALVVTKLLVVAVAGLFRELRPRYGQAIALGLALPWTATVLVNATVLATL